MHLLKKLFAAAAFATVSLSAHATQADIKVWATVDPTLALLKADGTALDDMVEMSHRPGAAGTGGLTPWSQSVRIFTNDDQKDVQIRLGQEAKLSATLGGGADVPLTVSLGGNDITTTEKTLTAAQLFDGTDITGASIALPLTIKQTTQAAITTAGLYEGIVSIVLMQAP
ncbi:fimbrial protein [Stenotrophomonas sp. HMWF022]|uniref:CS1 type fimbrial major subunit n=1 Tax=Stenotrophomonas sp. HMWF023 TaxID=2056859 RepID=UPI000D37CA9C|nr:CS1 type fimbrial major subunit [Stenotrophomonas sp. HMWF023]PTS80402.1 fimbrial protein [Stenotrophomonas sp. HMWF023]PTT54955.1 fimbrial protein [Stenotrophomonas sp. HMWF022]